MSDDHVKYLLEKPHRREFIRNGLFSLAAWPFLINRPLQSLVRKYISLEEYPFQLGIASGDPAADGFVLWTRLAPKPLEGGGMPATNALVRWQVANDEKMSQVVARGEVIATPELAHSVHVDF